MGLHKGLIVAYYFQFLWSVTGFGYLKISAYIVLDDHFLYITNHTVEPKWIFNDGNLK